MRQRVGSALVVGSSSPQIDVADREGALVVQAVVLAKLVRIPVDVTDADFHLTGRLSQKAKNVLPFVCLRSRRGCQRYQRSLHSGNRRPDRKTILSGFHGMLPIRDGYRWNLLPAGWFEPWISEWQFRQKRAFD